MLAGKAQSLETCVFKAERVSTLWQGQPLIFRLFMLPFVIRGFLKLRSKNEDLVFLDLGIAGEELDLLNEHYFQSPDDPEGMELVAYAADTVFPVGSSKTPGRSVVVSVLTALQLVAWCVQGKELVMVATGDHGGKLPDWSWEYVRQGPQITNVRLKTFDGSGSGGPSGQTTGHGGSGGGHSGPGGGRGGPGR